MVDVWASGAEYEAYIGRWSRPVAIEFLDWLDVPRGRRWVDVGCGTGALTEAVLARCDPSDVLAIDPSEAYVAWAGARVTDPRARFRVGDAATLAPTSADVVVSGLVLNFVADPAAAVSAMRTAAAGGQVAAYVWDYGAGMELLRSFWDAALELDPGAAFLDEAVRFPLCDPERMQTLWTEAGLVDVSSRAIEVPTVFRDADDYWRPFLGGQGPAPGYLRSLDDDARRRLHDRLLARLPVAPDGSIALTARAWAVRGRSA